MRIRTEHDNAAGGADAPPGRRRIFNVVLAILVALGLTLAATTGVLVWRMHDQALRDADQALRRLTLILAEQAERAFGAVEMVQVGLLDQLQSEGVGTPEAFRARMSPHAVHERLTLQARLLPQLDAVTVIDVDGNLINTTRAWPVVTVNVADRDYFQALRVEHAPEAFLSVPVRNRSTGTWTMYLARRVSAPDGSFIGLILAAMQLNYFEQLYQRIATGRDQAVSMFRTDGVLLARYPHAEPAIGTSFDRGLAFSQRMAGETDTIVVRKRSLVDGLERLIATRPLNHLPVVINVMDSVAAILAEWRTQASYLIGTTIILELAFASIGLLVVRQTGSQRRLHRAEASLAIATERERAAREMRVQTARYTHMAHHDALTGLPNRVLFQERLGQAVLRTSRGEGCALLYLDLDHFKMVNDTLGHPIGDALLRAVSGRLREAVRETDTVARLGGDEFAIVQSSADQPEDATALAGHLIKALSAPYEIDGHQIAIGTSIGIVMAPGDGNDPDQLLKHVDLALYRCKAEGRGRYRFFGPEMDAEMQARRTLEVDLRRALAEGEFEVFYQPLMNIKARSVTGFEALVRWRHPERGLLSPAAFIPLAEEIGLIIPLGAWVLGRACLDAMSWPDAIKVAVNVSVVQFASPTLVDDVVTALAKAGLAPNRLELEITETVMLDDTEAVLAVLYKLRDLGVGIAMDDFGTGYSSLSYLRRFPFSKVKIDRSFISGLGGGGDCDAIVTAMTNLCETLGMTTLAEGLETEEQLRQLRAGNCGEAQGYLFSQPRPADEVAALCRTLGQNPVQTIPYPGYAGSDEELGGVDYLSVGN